MDYSSKTRTNTLSQQKHGEFRRSHNVDTLMRNYRGFLMVVIRGLCLPSRFFACQSRQQARPHLFPAQTSIRPGAGSSPPRAAGTAQQHSHFPRGRRSPSPRAAGTLKTLLKVRSNEGTAFRIASLSLQTFHRQEPAANTASTSAFR